MKILIKLFLCVYVFNMYGMYKDLSKSLNLKQPKDIITICFKQNVPFKEQLSMSLTHATPIDEKIALWKKAAKSFITPNNLCIIIKSIPDSGHTLSRDSRVLHHYHTISNEIDNLLQFGIVNEQSKIIMALSYIRVGLSYPGCFTAYTQAFAQTTCANKLDSEHDIKTFIEIFKNCDLKKAKFFAAFFLFYKASPL